MTKNDLAELTLDILQWDTTDRPLDPRTIYFAADQIRGSAIPAYLLANPGISLGLFCVPQAYDIQLDTIRNLFYVELSEQVLGGIQNTGLIQVSLAQDEDNDFIIRDMGMNSVANQLESGYALGNTICWPEGTKIYFRKTNTAGALKVGETKILVKAVTSLKTMDDDTEIPQPYEFNDILINGCIKYFREKKGYAEDLTNDNNSEPGKTQ